MDAEAVSRILKAIDAGSAPGGTPGRYWTIVRILQT